MCLKNSSTMPNESVKQINRNCGSNTFENNKNKQLLKDFWYKIKVKLLKKTKNYGVNKF